MITRSIGVRTMSKLLKAMWLCRAVPEIPAEISVPPGLPLNKIRSLPTHSESTLPQLLISLHFISFSSNVYRKPGEGAPYLSRKVLQFVTTCLPILRTHTNSRLPRAPFARGNPNPFYALLHNSLDVQGGRRTLPVGQPNSSPLRGFRAMNPGCLSHIPDHGRRNTGHSPLVPQYRCAATRKVPESRLLRLGGTLGNISAPGGV
jgi:hypothetical protein